MLKQLAIAAAAAFASWVSVAYFKKWALEHRVLDIPNDRSSHRVPVPRGGGIALVATVIVAMILELRNDPSPRIAIAWMGGSVLIAVVSWLDDLKSLPMVIRLIAQSSAAALVIAAAQPIREIGAPPLGFLPFGSAGDVLMFLWIVGLTNAFNFMDGIDGIAAGQAAIAGAAAAVVGQMQNETTVTFLGLFIAASSIGFLLHNWSPATIFMGDVGSAFLGYSLAVMPLMSRRSQPELLLVDICVLWPFLFDTIFTFARRSMKRENVLKAHRSHLYQRLVHSGASHASVALLYITLATIGAVLGVAALRSVSFGIAALVSIPAMAVGLLAAVRVSESRNPAYHES